MSKLRKECFNNNCTNLQLIAKKDARSGVIKAAFKCAAQKMIRMSLTGWYDTWNCLHYKKKKEEA